MTRILVVEDDIYMMEELLDVLNKSGYEALAVRDFDNTIEQIISCMPDLILLDINLPGQSGFEICKSLAAKGIGPILVLTARDRLQDELHALGLGADDYITKPFNMERLLARIKNLLRRKKGNDPRQLLDGKSFLIDPDTYTLYVDKHSYLLPPSEGKILVTLLLKSPNIVTKTELNQELWGTDEYIDENTLQVNVTRLRKKLGKYGIENCVETIHGKGYRLKEWNENEKDKKDT